MDCNSKVKEAAGLAKRGWHLWLAAPDASRHFVCKHPERGLPRPGATFYYTSELGAEPSPETQDVSILITQHYLAENLPPTPIAVRFSSIMIIASQGPSPEVLPSQSPSQITPCHPPAPSWTDH